MQGSYYRKVAIYNIYKYTTTNSGVYKDAIMHRNNVQEQKQSTNLRTYQGNL